MLSGYLPFAIVKSVGPDCLTCFGRRLTVCFQACLHSVYFSVYSSFVACKRHPIILDLLDDVLFSMVKALFKVHHQAVFGK